MMGFFGPYVYVSKKNKKKYYLHMKQKGKRVLYYFSEDPEGALFDLPPGYEVVESPKTGLPFLKKSEFGGFLGFLFRLFGIKPPKKEKKKEI